MKQLTALAIAACAAASVSGATVDQVIARQQWPWSTDVKVEYKLADVTTAQDITVRAYSGDTLIGDSSVAGSALAKAMRGDIYAVSGATGTIYIDPSAAFGTAKSALTDFKVSLETADSPAALTQELYRLYDLNDGSCQSLSRADIMNHADKYGSYETDFSKIGPGFTTTLAAADVFIWTGVTNNPLYKTDKLVLRRIPAKDVVWQYGGSTQYVKLTEDYFIGVFEITQAQWTKVYGANYSHNQDAADAATRAAEGMSSSEVYGADNTEWGAIGHNGNHLYGYCKVNSKELLYWPKNTYLRDVLPSSFLGKLWNKTQTEFHLPTQAQWEFACRAGTSSDYNSGKAQSRESAKEVAWTELDATVAMPVGLKAANAFGLYDMHGNVGELALGNGIVGEQTGKAATADDPLIDPVGGTQNSTIPKRGGSIGGNADLGGWTTTTSSSVKPWYNSGQLDLTFVGFRVICPVGRQWVAH